MQLLVVLGIAVLLMNEIKYIVKAEIHSHLHQVIHLFHKRKRDVFAEKMGRAPTKAGIISSLNKMKNPFLFNAHESASSTFGRETTSSFNSIGRAPGKNQRWNTNEFPKRRENERTNRPENISKGGRAPSKNG